MLPICRSCVCARAVELEFALTLALDWYCIVQRGIGMGLIATLTCENFPLLFLLFPNLEKEEEETREDAG